MEALLTLFTAICVAAAVLLPAGALVFVMLYANDIIIRNRAVRGPRFIWRASREDIVMAGTCWRLPQYEEAVYIAFCFQGSVTVVRLEERDKREADGAEGTGVFVSTLTLPLARFVIVACPATPDERLRFDALLERAGSSFYEYLREARARAVEEQGR